MKITKCDTQYCPSAKLCLRKTITAIDFQKYYHFPLPSNALHCKDFWPLSIDPDKYDSEDISGTIKQ